jgi:hypothetical protein
MPHNQFLVKKVSRRGWEMQSGINLGGQNYAIETWELKSNNYEN